ncbi:MAG: TlpA disulfide reductase family protein [Pseudomonadota bacterium]
MFAKARRIAIPTMVLGLGLAIVYVFASAAGGGERASRLERLATGSMAGLDFAYAGDAVPGETFADPAGAETTLAAFAGRATLVNLWATWCAPCEREMPSLAALQSARGGEAFQVVAISVDDADQADFARGQLAEWTGGVLDFYHAPDFAISYGLGARGFPTTVLFDADGREVARLSGEADWSSYEAVAFIDAALAGAR